ncbi:hypothetical protein ANANG_G00143760 [Anguilla anguilla]|uniref:Adenosine deaminase n=1 Tax=Anguilla anguilla TaxID=7936 RepID=A0A9D3MBA2_ANGAN|nr:hypothetical protein ANANG_G00143760 [Anguilla anguilla]
MALLSSLHGSQVTLLSVLLLCWAGVCGGIPDPRQRELLIQQEASRQTGGTVVLTEAERRLSAQLHKLKQQEVEGPQFPPALHFFKALPLIQRSPVFRLLQKMPKGAALHIHDFAVGGVDWLMKNVTYRPHCYICFTASQSVRFLFSAKRPRPLPQCSAWVLLETLRGKVDNTTDLDNRGLNVSEVKAVVEEAIHLQKEFPEVMAGFDLVGREDGGRPLWYFREALSLPAELGVTLPYFFHAGETAKELSRKRDVAVEVGPISNQVLGLVSDLRNHPAAALMSEGHPMVVSSDDPATFGATGLSYDFYEAFVGLGGMNAHLGTLKELAINSIR